MICKFIGIKLTEKRVQNSDEIISYSVDQHSVTIVSCHIVSYHFETDKISGDRITCKAVRNK